MAFTCTCTRTSSLFYKMFQTYFWFWSQKQKKETSKVQVQMQIKATCWQHAGLFIILLNAKQLVDRCLASLIFHPPALTNFPSARKDL
jgi:hypothetical protein